MKEILKPSILNTGKILSLFSPSGMFEQACAHEFSADGGAVNPPPPPVALILNVMAVTYSLKLCAHF